MMSMEQNHMHRMLSSNEDTRRLLYLSSLNRPHAVSQGIREIPSQPHRQTIPDLSGTSQTNHKRLTDHQNHPKRLTYHQTGIVPNNPVSRRNARERKRVRLVNLGFSTLRERVPSKNKKLSKVETLRAAIEYIRQLQGMLGLPDSQLFEDCSSSETSGQPGGSGNLSPASSHPSECSLVPYENMHQHQEDQLMDIGLWFT
ncbi:hypothetical protein JTE90_014432 [Oedothorax gibbosus]|uniref:BHLH domain-containing protein n=1 Tax=Oedothorax gibbosus TaxID=931172 RepID=A0AAV6V148_9ARAC|nr:hypothetical protein JTE90_014432 [Oedothorax gibbosus]